MRRRKAVKARISIWLRCIILSRLFRAYPLLKNKQEKPKVQ